MNLFTVLLLAVLALVSAQTNNQWNCIDATKSDAGAAVKGIYLSNAIDVYKVGANGNPVALGLMSPYAGKNIIRFTINPSGTSMYVLVSSGAYRATYSTGTGLWAWDSPSLTWTTGNFHEFKTGIVQADIVTCSIEKNSKTKPGMISATATAAYYEYDRRMWSPLSAPSGTKVTSVLSLNDKNSVFVSLSSTVSGTPGGIHYFSLTSAGSYMVCTGACTGISVGPALNFIGIASSASVATEANPALVAAIEDGPSGSIYFTTFGANPVSQLVFIAQSVALAGVGGGKWTAIHVTSANIASVNVPNKVFVATSAGYIVVGSYSGTTSSSSYAAAESWTWAPFYSGSSSSIPMVTAYADGSIFSFAIPGTSTVAAGITTSSVTRAPTDAPSPKPSRSSPSHSPHWLAKNGGSSTPTKDPTPKPTSTTLKPTRAAGETARPTIKPTHSAEWLRTHGNSNSPTTFPQSVRIRESHFRHVVSGEGVTAVDEEEAEVKSAGVDEEKEVVV